MSVIMTRDTQMLTFADIQKINAERFRKEREEDARRLAEYQAECLKSWETEEVK